jgi:hypothetical protein
VKIEFIYVLFLSKFKLWKREGLLPLWNWGEED